MEQNNINIAVLLKDCPKGTKLYSPICGECEYDGITELGYVSVLYNNQESGWDFDKYGHLCDDTEHKGECLLFPSKEVRDWGCFKVKYAKGGDGITEGKKVHKLLLANGGMKLEDGTWDCNDPTAIYYIDAITHTIKRTNTISERVRILSTGTELKLEEEQPKFKVGDVVAVYDGFGRKYDFYFVNDKYGGAYNNNYEKPYQIANSEKDLNSIRLATPEEIAKWNKDVLEPNHLHYSTSKRKIIHWFLPKDYVLVKNTIGKGEEWRLCVFSHYSKRTAQNPYCAAAKYWSQCLPYNERTAKLIGTTDDYEEE